MDGLASLLGVGGDVLTGPRLQLMGLRAWDIQSLSKFGGSFQNAFTSATISGQSLGGKMPGKWQRKPAHRAAASCSLKPQAKPLPFSIFVSICVMGTSTHLPSRVPRRTKWNPGAF